MQIVSTASECRSIIKTWQLAGERVAFVPTMGNLHDGHIKLVTEAQKQAERVVVSIFVNPTQFGPGEDFDSYPRTEAADQAKLAAAGANLVFLPAVSEVYASNAKTTVSVNGLSTVYCGAARPGHFDGVATVVCKLFNIVQPDLALFGRKDFQQLAVIRTMVRDLNIPVDIIGVDTVREASGLAMSSRNGYLSAQEKQTAAQLYQTLCQARDAVLAKQSFPDIDQQALNSLKAAGFVPDYFVICRSDDLAKANSEDTELVILVAARLGKTRLIDNIAFSRS
ncbi:MAG: pantoate--beta-alanine ligase [Methylococcaceae bacterium]|nr:pantoate--beta-alanine ligase [Methylococcaceae bacterium]MDZ4156936.1 pantoate--beta-alanine ligase [Methylococcales bacterium]MDP2394016.1 pantoate--beta-alanine ligase [Methylococcaceae bacterium]MDP3018520.1 pantoate--beta-alanine ligase [Methylococcaceae bacterium]MDP3390954.1 pantoate--beta-alanine ligase [Methylococcaceae bacterium]